MFKKTINPLSARLAKNRKDLDNDVEDFYALLSESESQGAVVFDPDRKEDIPESDTEEEGEEYEDAEDLAKIEEKNDLDEDYFSHEYEGQLSLDVYEIKNEFVILSAIAGVRAEDIDVSVTNDMVTIRGRRDDLKAPKDADYLFSECYWGNFSRTIILPAEIDTKKISAKITNGILTVRLVKAKKDKSVIVKVNER